MAFRERDEILLLGEHHTRWGAYRLEVAADRRTACTISIGADPASAASAFKKDPDAANEDALFAVTETDRRMFAVADAHFGLEASHDLLLALRDTTTPLPRNLEDLQARIAACGIQAPDAHYASETTLLVAVVEPDGRGFGVSFGDSTLALVSEHGTRVVTTKSDDFVSRLQWTSLVPERGNAFEFDPATPAMLCAFTDGIDECCYRRPERSIRAEHLHALYLATGTPSRFAAELTELALDGVDDNPGGEDNIALIVSRV